MNIFVRCGGFNNKGDESMLLTVQSELTKRLGNVNICLRVTQAQVKRAYDAGMTPIYFQDSIKEKIIKIIRSGVRDVDLLAHALFSPTGVIEETELTDIDAIIDISGFAYGDVWGTHHARSGIVHARRLKKKNRPYICLPQAWGPFTDKKVIKDAKTLCENVRKIYARDQESFNHLKNLGTDDGKGKLKICPDISFLFKGAPVQVGKNILFNNGIEFGKNPLIGMTPNMKVYERMQGKGMDNAYIQTMAQVAIYCMDNFNAAIILMPHHIDFGTLKRDDRYLCSLIRAAISHRGKALVLPDYYSANQTRSIIENLDMLIGSRFHTIVFALSACVPSVALGWAHKYKELLRLVDQEHSEVDFKMFSSTDVCRIVDNVWRHRDEYKNQLEKKIPEVQMQVDNVFKDTVEILSNIQ